jgi:hypothetical protein
MRKGQEVSQRSGELWRIGSDALLTDQQFLLGHLVGA